MTGRLGDATMVDGLLTLVSTLVLTFDCRVTISLCFSFTTEDGFVGGSSAACDADVWLTPGKDPITLFILKI